MRFIGCRIVTATPDAELTATLRESWDIPELDERPTVLTITVSRRAAIPPTIRARARDAHRDDRGLVALEGESEAWIVSPGTAACVALRSGGVEVVAYGEVPDDPLPLHSAVAEAIATTGLVPLHAAVLTRGGHTVAMLGPSGAGKSTSAVLAMLDGWGLLSEDAAWVDPATLDVFGADQGVRLRSGGEAVVAARLADHHGIDVAALPHDGLKRLLSYDAIGGRVRRARLDEVVLLDPAAFDPAAVDPAAVGPGEDPPRWMRPAEVAMALHQASGIPAIVNARTARATAVGRLAVALPGRRVYARSGSSPI